VRRLYTFRIAAAEAPVAPIVYVDFDLEIARAPHGYRAIVNSAAGQISRDFSLPFSDLELENFVLRMGYPRRAVRGIDSPQIEAVKTFGGQLFAAVFADAIGASLRSHLDDALQHDAGLRIRLHLTGVPELLDLPWEYLYNSALNRFLSLSAKTPIIRYLELPERVRPLAVTPPLRVLAMVSSPKDYPPLNVEQEWFKLRTALDALEQRGLVTLDRLVQATLPALQRQLRQGTYHIFHFIGHGGFDQHTQDGVLILEDEDKSGWRISAQDLGTLLHDEDTLRLAVLNACEGARAARTDPFAGTAQSLIQQGIPAVIAMQFEITDEAAITLTREFFGALADDYPVDAALAEARKALFTEGSGVEWGTPVLYMRAPDGRIFDVVAPASGPTAGPAADTSKAVTSIPNDSVRRVVQPVAALAKPVQRNRDRMLQKVRAFWVEGVLEHSLHGAALIDMGLEQHPEAIAHPWEMLVQQGDQPPEPFASGTTITTVFDARGGEVLILGAPGAGKTTMLLELTRDLISRAALDDSYPLPVVFNLASWARRRRPLTDWLVDELNMRYDIPRKIGQEWVDADQILPLLDGLDEVQAEHREACVDAINIFRCDHGLVSLVVCSRIADYDVLAAPLKLQDAVRIQPLTPAQIDAYLARAGSQLAMLRAVLAEDATLRELAESPLLLSIMTLTYADVTAEALPTHGTVDERRIRLFAEYVDRMFARRGVETRYPRQQTISWLVWLARTMGRQAQAIFFIERLQPLPLLTGVQQRHYAIGVGLILGLIFGLGGGIGAGLLNGLVVEATFGILVGVGNGVVAGVIVGLLFGLAVIKKETFAVSSLGTWFSIRHVLYRGSALGLVVGLSDGLVAWLASKWLDGYVGGLGVWFWLSGGLFSGLLNGLVFGLIIGLVANPGKIDIVENLRWSWAKAKTAWKVGSTFGVGSGVVIGISNGLDARLLSLGPSTEFVVGLASGSAIALATILTLMVANGLTTGEIETKTVPNQGIRRSARNVLSVGSSVSLVIGLAAGLIFWVLQRLFGLSYGMVADLAFGLFYGLPFGLAVGLLYGGLACVQHFVLRYILYRAGAMPWNYTRFLDYCVERIFLRKVGGGYIFVHRLLMEYFAAVDQGETTRSEA
jgi:hypothetical protein